MRGKLDMSRSTTSGHEFVDGIAYNAFLLGQQMSEWFGDTTPTIEDDSAATTVHFFWRHLWDQMSMTKAV